MLACNALPYTRIGSPLRPASPSLQRAQTVQASQGTAAPLPSPIKVVGCGSCGIDYLASIAKFPKPDEKLRTNTLEVQGGGNAANALTAAARLGLSPVLFTKIGGDGLGDSIISELQRDGVSTEFVLREEGHPSPFTYIIVDREGGTRTCIHTPGAALEPQEVTQERLAGLLADARLVYFDGRLTEAAILLAKAAREAGVPVLVEGERLRPYLDQLLGLADYVVTSANFPREWTGEEGLGDALVSLAARLPAASMIITTLGTRGSVMLTRAPGDQAEGSSQTMDDIMQQLHSQMATTPASTSRPDCVSANGISIRRGGVAQTSGPVRLTYSRGRDAAAATSNAQAAAAHEASRNADVGNAGGYVATAVAESTAQGSSEVVVRVTVAQAAVLPKEAVADTTGAGDSFIGSVLYGLVTGMDRQQMLQLAAVVAACKCTALGARPGLPKRDALSAELVNA